MNLADGYQAIMAAAAKAWEIPAKLWPSDWADRYRVVPSKSSPEGGRWRTSRTPYAAEPLNELSSMSTTQMVIIMAASQVLKTEVLLNWIFESIDQDPAPMLVVQPTEKAVGDFVGQRLDPAIKLMPRISALIPPSSKRDGGNKRTEKNFPGGALYLGWSNSATELASKPIKKLGLDEVDRYPVTLKDEGSPVALAVQRTANFPRRKVLMTSTPKIKGASTIADEYETSSQAQYWVPCPHCGTHQVLVWESLRWKKTVDADGTKRHWPHTAVYVCRDCGAEIEERFKPQMLEGGEWRHKYPERAKRGYHINGLYSPVGLGRSWGERAEIFLESKDDPKKLQTFVNLHLGEPFEDHSDAVQADSLKDRAEPYKLRTILPGYVLLTLGVDVQKDRFAFHLVAWARGERCHTVDYLEIPADPSRSDQWGLITEYRRKVIRNSFGVDMRISMTAIDSSNGAGGHTNEAYKYARKYRFDGVMVVKGASQPNKPILGRPSKQDVKNEKGDVDRNGVDLWIVGVDTCKGAIYSRLDGDALHESPHERMLRFSEELPMSFFEGIASEVFDADTGLWQKRPGRKNEPLDTWNYAYAAAHHPRIAIHTARDADWEELERQLEPRVADLFAATVMAVDVPAPSQAHEAMQTSAQDPAPGTLEPLASPVVVASPGEPERLDEDHDQDDEDPWIQVRDNWLD